MSNYCNLLCPSYLALVHIFEVSPACDTTVSNVVAISLALFVVSGGGGGGRGVGQIPCPSGLRRHFRESLWGDYRYDRGS